MLGKETLGTFSSHWAACAALIRISSAPEFESLGGDKRSDLDIEKSILQSLKARQLHGQPLAKAENIHNS